MLEGGLGTSLKMSLSISHISLVSVSFFLRCRDVIAFSPDKEGAFNKWNGDGEEI